MHDFERGSFHTSIYFRQVPTHVTAVMKWTNDNNQCQDSCWKYATKCEFVIRKLLELKPFSSTELYFIGRRSKSMSKPDYMGVAQCQEQKVKRVSGLVTDCSSESNFSTRKTGCRLGAELAGRHLATLVAGPAAAPGVRLT